MATRYWVGGVATFNTANAWSATNGGAGGASIPSSVDDVLLTSTPATYWSALTALSLATYRAPTTPNGFAYEVTTAGTTGAIEPTWTTTIGDTVTDGTVVFTCRRASLNVSAQNAFYTLDFTGYDGALILTSNLVTANGGGASTFITFSNTMSISGAGRFGLGTGGTATITSNGLTIATELRLTSGGTLVLGSDLNYTNTFGGSLAGTNVNFNGYNLTCVNWNFPSIGTLTMSSPSVLTVTGASFIGSGKTYNEVNLTGSTTCTITGENVFDTLNVIGGAARNSKQITLSNNITVNTLLSLKGNSAYNRLFITSSTFDQRTITCNSSVDITDCDIRDINGAGTAAPLDATTLGNADCWGNSNINFPTPVTRYKRGNSFNSVSSWSDISGGSVGFSIPTPQDTIIIDANNSGGDMIVSNIGRMCRNLYLINAPASRLNGNTPFEVLGDFECLSNAQNGALNLSLTGRGNHTLKKNVSWTNLNGININTNGGTYTASGDIAINSPFTVTRGFFDLNNYNLNSTTFVTSFTSPRSIILGSGNISLSSTGTVWNATTTTNLTFDAGTSTIKLTNTSATARTFAGGGRTYNNLEIGGATGVSELTITGSNIFNTISDTKTVAYTINLTSGTTTTVTNWTAGGTSGNLLTLKASTTSAATLAKAGGGTATINYANISYITGSPINTWYATNSTNGGNNTNITFGAPPGGVNSSFLMLF